MRMIYNWGIIRERVSERLCKSFQDFLIQRKRQFFRK